MPSIDATVSGPIAASIFGLVNPARKFAVQSFAACKGDP
jgi:hypothetical protein